MRPGLEGEIRLVNVETARRDECGSPRRETARYVEVFEQFLDELRTFCMHRQIDYYPWTTDQPFEDAILGPAQPRSARLAGSG